MQNYIRSSIQNAYLQVFNIGSSSVSKTVDILQMEKPKNSQGVSHGETR
jgi:hypothetical protein